MSGHGEGDGGDGRGGRWTDLRTSDFCEVKERREGFVLGLFKAFRFQECALRFASRNAPCVSVFCFGAQWIKSFYAAWLTLMIILR